MTAATLTLTDFLLARIAEDERAAREAYRAPWTSGEDWVRDGEHDDDEGPMAIISGGVYRNVRRTAAFIARHDPGRVLAECAAKRAIVELAWHHLGEDEYADGMEHAKEQVLALVAAVYAEHPDYRDEWRA